MNGTAFVVTDSDIIVLSKMTPHFRRAGTVIGIFLSAHACLGAEEDRIHLSVAINGKAETFFLDTGCGSAVAISRWAAERLKLKITAPPGDFQPRSGEIAVSQTEACTVTLLGLTWTTRLAVIDMPYGLEIEEAGIVGWPVLSREISRFKSDGNREQVDIGTTLPRDLSEWLKVRIISGSTLTLEASGAGGKLVRIRMDTGDSDGVCLRADLFRKWRDQHRHVRATLSARVYPGVGMMVSEEVWADELRLGGILFRNVPLIEGTDGNFRGQPPNTIAVLGMAAIRRLDLVTDGRTGSAYVRPSRNVTATATATATYNYNRLGAVFVPRDSQSRDLTAVVLKNSPAARAGVRDGDILLKIDSHDMSAWRSQPEIRSLLGQIRTRPAGTRLLLSLKRDSDTVVIPVVLQEILGPGSGR